MAKEKISCKEFFSLNGEEDLKKKLILDYEKSYYKLCEETIYNKHYGKDEHSINYHMYSGQMRYIGYIFMYIFDENILKFADKKGIENKVEKFTKHRLMEKRPDNWLEVYNENSYESIIW